MHVEDAHKLDYKRLLERKKDENDLDYLEIDPSRVLAAITIQKAYKAYKSKQ